MISRAGALAPTRGGRQEGLRGRLETEKSTAREGMNLRSTQAITNGLQGVTGELALKLVKQSHYDVMSWLYTG